MATVCRLTRHCRYNAAEVACASEEQKRLSRTGVIEKQHHCGQQSQSYQTSCVNMLYALIALQF